MSALPNPLAARAVDWPKVFTTLRNRGLSVYDIARRTGIPRSTLQAYDQGVCQPPHHVGELIIGVWANETQQHRAVLPLVTSYFNQPPMI